MMNREGSGSVGSNFIASAAKPDRFSERSGRCAACRDLDDDRDGVQDIAVV
jgi:hypothetical protein